MRIGVMVELRQGTADRVEDSFAHARRLGVTGCQLCCWDESLLQPDVAEAAAAGAAAAGVRISTFWCGWPGPRVWDFYDGQATLGLVPAAYRHVRAETLKRGAAFARHLGVEQMATHAGFIPENPNDPAYHGTAAALRDVARRCRDLGVTFLFETGQETPVTLRRLIEDLGGGDGDGGGGVGVNFDPANLLLYGKANPVDAVDILGPYIRDIHAKDGEYPTDGRRLGVEKPLGQGRVDWPRLIARLKALGYDGPITIEREITGEERDRDVMAAAALLRGLIGG